MAGIIISASDPEAAFELGNYLSDQKAALERIGAKVYGPAPAPIARVRGRFRVRLLIKAAKTAPLQKAISEWLRQVKMPNGIRLSIDIDPQSFL